MSEPSPFPVSAPPPSGLLGSSTPGEKLARRRMLLTSLGKGSMVIGAAALPLRSLASQTVRTKTDGKSGGPFIAAVSANGSMATSKADAMPVSQGFSASYYAIATNWPETSYRNKKFNNVFGDGSSDSLSDIVGRGTSESHWVISYLNAHPNKCNNTNFYYPYDQAEIKALYVGGPGKPTRTACEDFFAKHMENMLA